MESPCSYCQRTDGLHEAACIHRGREKPAVKIQRPETAAQEIDRLTRENATLREKENATNEGMPDTLKFVPIDWEDDWDEEDHPGICPYCEMSDKWVENPHYRPPTININGVRNTADDEIICACRLCEECGIRIGRYTLPSGHSTDCPHYVAWTPEWEREQRREWKLIKRADTLESAKTIAIVLLFVVVGLLAFWAAQEPASEFSDGAFW